MLTINSIVYKNDNSIESKIDDEIVLLNLDNDDYYSMDSIGSDIWKELADKVSVNSIVKILLQKYDVNRETCTKHTLNFLNSLYEKQIISIDS